MLLTAVCLVSTLFWSNPEGDSFLHKADNLLAWTYCAAMMWCAVHCGEGRKLHFTTFALLVVLILVCFLLIDLFFQNEFSWVAIAGASAFSLCVLLVVTSSTHMS